MGPQGRTILEWKERKELKVGIDIPLKTVKIVGWRETCTRQGVSKEMQYVE